MTDAAPLMGVGASLDWPNEHVPFANPIERFFGRDLVGVVGVGDDVDRFRRR